MAHHQPYPGFSTECVQDLYRIITGGLIREEIKLFAKCLYTIEGAGLGMAVGEPDDVEPLFSAAEPDVESVEKLRDEMVAIGDIGLPKDTFGASGDSEAIGPLGMLLIQQGIKMALKALEAWLAKRKEA